MICFRHDFKICNSINSSFPMNELHVFQEDILELEITLLSYEWLNTNPFVPSCPFEMNTNFFPYAKFLNRSDDSNWLTELRGIFNFEFDCVSLVHETWCVLIIIDVKCGLLLWHRGELFTSILRFIVHIVMEIRRLLVLDLQVLDINDLLGRIVKKFIGSICIWGGLILIFNMRLLYRVNVRRVCKLLEKRLLVYSGRCLVVAYWRVVA